MKRGVQGWTVVLLIVSLPVTLPAILVGIGIKSMSGSSSIMYSSHPRVTAPPRCLQENKEDIPTQIPSEKAMAQRVESVGRA